MNMPYQRGPKGVRGDRKSGSKESNLTQFQPYWSSTEKIYSKYYKEFKNRKTPLIFIDNLYKEFIFPVSKENIQFILNDIPEKFIRGIKAILIPSGSKKQVKSSYSLHTLGEYWNECIILHPFPKFLMIAQFKKNLKPSLVHEYERVGATINQDKSGMKIKWDKDSLKKFYLQDVLMHEIGHHNEVYYKRPINKRERFAEWFATEYGFRLWD